MRKLSSILIIILILPCIAFGQKKYRAPTKQDEALARKHNQCLHTNKFTAKERRLFFPFTGTASIRLISFEIPIPNSPNISNDAPLLPPIPAEDTMQLFTPMAVNHYYVNYCRVQEMKILSEASIDSLTDILYNIGLTPVKNLRFETADRGYSCYNPRNAILFLDAKGKVTNYIEFCFECKRFYYSSSKTKEIIYCEQKLDLLKNFFLKAGVTYGTVLPKRELE